MMSRTHISFGVATSLLATQPKTVSGCFVAVLGGSIGGIISDIDTRSNKYCRDALYGRLIVVGIIVICRLGVWVSNLGKHFKFSKAVSCCYNWSHFTWYNVHIWSVYIA